MAATTQTDDVVNVTFQLKGQQATDFREYMEREHIEINSVAGKKLALERLEAWKKEALAQV